MPVIVEIKGDNGPNVADRTVDVVRKMEAVERVVVAGFSQVSARSREGDGARDRDQRLSR